MEASEVPTQLKNKWIQITPELNHQCMPSLSKISEVDSTQSNFNLRQVALAEPLSGDALRNAENDANASKPPLQRNLPSMVVECPAGEDGDKKMADDFPPKRRPSVKMITTPIRKMMHKLSISHESVDDANKGLGRLSIRKSISNHGTLYRYMKHLNILRSWTGAVSYGDGIGR
jgi:hypothetical protein